MYSKLGLKITNEQFDFKIKNSKFNRIGDYINTITPIKFSCKICNKIFIKKPKEFNKLKCSCIDRLNCYKEYLKDKNIVILNTFHNFRVKINHKCLNCDNEFISSPKVVKNSKFGCPYCSGTKISHNDYIKKLPIDIMLIGKYINSYSKIEHKCLKCNNNWFTKPNYILHMYCGCPFCAASKGERIILNLLKKLNIEFESEKFIDINGKTYYYDFYLPIHNLLIEYDGIQHFESVKFFGGDDQFLLTKKSDEIKNKWAEINNITLLRIPYYDNDIIEALILNKL